MLIIIFRITLDCQETPIKGEHIEIRRDHCQARVLFHEIDKQRRQALDFSKDKECLTDTL